MNTPFELLTYQVTHASPGMLTILGMFCVLMAYGSAAFLTDVGTMQSPKIKLPTFLVLSFLVFFGICGGIVFYGYNISERVLAIANNPEVKLVGINQEPNGQLSAWDIVLPETETSEEIVMGKKTTITKITQPKQKVFLNDATIQYLSQNNTGIAQWAQQHRIAAD